MVQLLFCWARIGWKCLGVHCARLSCAGSSLCGSQVTLKWIGLLTGGWVKVLVFSMPVPAWHEWSVEMVGTSLQYSSKATRTDTSRNQACGDRPHLKVLNGNCCGLSCSVTTCACSRLLARAQSLLCYLVGGVRECDICFDTMLFLSLKLEFLVAWAVQVSLHS